MVAKVVPATLPAAIATPRKGTALIGALVAVAAYAIFQSPIASAGGAPGWRGGVEAASRAFATHVLAFGVAPTLASIAVHGGITNRVALKCSRAFHDDNMDDDYGRVPCDAHPSQPDVLARFGRAAPEDDGSVEISFAAWAVSGCVRRFGRRGIVSALLPLLTVAPGISANAGNALC
ncbi:hypothetical protein PPROV_000302400 [Pycnococcus provasolii]|uniref:Uncharacterized protein n=1 Tax=Pycnococcus provasolii TaxID=41880 RepID=A0A830HEP0_9CHLO|nr:hypothetical protein PPROV_000302400 [Pycnococcus provasolii]